VCTNVLFVTIQGHFITHCRCRKAGKLCRFLLLMQSDRDLSDMQSFSMKGRCGGLRKFMYGILGVALSRSL
jgi:hypothetical protein